MKWALFREIPNDTAELGWAVLRPDNAYRQIGERFDDLFPDETEFAELYEVTGRGAIPPLLLALVTVFQMLEKVPDREGAELVATRIDWKYALHLPLAYPGFHFCDLSAFRQRLVEHRQERMLFERLLKRLKDLGLIKARGKMRTDSTHVLAVVERLSQLELVLETIRVALRAVTDVAPDWTAQHLPAAFYETYQIPQSQYGMTQDEAYAKLIKAGRDGFWFLAQLDQSAGEVVRRLSEVVTLRTVLQQQFPQGPSGPPAAKRPHGTGVIESPHETEARRAAKRDKAWTGYKAQVTETCDEDRPHLIVDLEPTEAPAHDSPELEKIQARLQAQDTMPGEQYVDQSYISGKGIAHSEKLGINLKGLPLKDTRGPEGFRQVDFQVDEDNRQAICPAGKSATRWYECAGPEGEPAKIQIDFDAATCRACEFFGRCTKSARGRSLELHAYRKVLEARRAEAGTKAYREDMHKRAGIEGAISELVRGYGLRRARYRGLARLRLQSLFTAVAVNLKRATRWWARQPVLATETGVG